MRQEKTALVYAVDLLARQEHSERHLREKLERKGYAAEEIDAALARLKERRYLDDEAACARQFEHFYTDSHKSVRQICMKLQQRGFSRALIRSCVPQDTFEREQRAAFRTLELKYKPTADKQKMLASLFRQGFDMTASRAAVQKYVEAE